MTLPTQEQLHKLVCTLAPRWSDREIRGFHYLPGGYSNHNFRFRVDDDHYVIRAPGRAAARSEREREARFYDYFAQHSEQAGVPILIALDISTGAMISRWQEGPLLIDQPTVPDAVISYLSALHDILPGSAHDYDPLAVSRGFLSRGQPDQDVLNVLGSLRWVPENPRACHNDLNPWNVIFRTSEPWMTLDWEWFGNNDPLFDLITLHQGLGWDQDSLPDMAAELLGDEVSGDRLQRNLQAFWLREYAWAHAAIADGSQRAEIIEQKRVALDRFRSLSA